MSFLHLCYLLGGLLIYDSLLTLWVDSSICIRCIHQGEWITPDILFLYTRVRRLHQIYSFCTLGYVDYTRYTLSVHQGTQITPDIHFVYTRRKLTVDVHDLCCSQMQEGNSQTYNELLGMPQHSHRLPTQLSQRET